MTTRRFPVTISQLPTVRCTMCGVNIAHRPGQVSDVLTAHYDKVHGDELIPARSEA